MINILVLFSIFIIFFIGKYLFNNRKFYLLSWKLPGPVALPIIGNSMKFFCENEDILQVATNIISSYPSPMKFWLGPKFTVIISECEQASKILSSGNFSHKDDVYKFVKIMNGEGLISGSGPKWKRDRKLMGHLFTKKNVEEYFATVRHHVDIFLEKVEAEVGGGMFNIEKYLHRCCGDFVNETIVGVKTDAQNGNLDEFLEAIDRQYELVHARITKVWLQIEWFFRKTHYYIEQLRNKNIIHGFLKKVIKTNETKRDEISETFLGRIFDIMDEFPDFASDEELVHHMCTLYTASEDTMTTISSFTILLLGMYPKIQQQIFLEINGLIEDQTIKIEHLSKLKYLDMCIKDVLRLFPIAPFIVRKTSEDFQLDQWIIPKDSSVIVSIYNIHRSPKHWEKPDEFYPEHFLPEAVKRRYGHAFLPFSAGPRGCLGKAYSDMCLKLLIASVVRKYKIYANGKIENIRLKTDITIRPKNRQFPVRFELRN